MPHTSGMVLGIWGIINEWNSLIATVKSLSTPLRNCEVEDNIFKPDVTVQTYNPGRWEDEKAKGRFHYIMGFILGYKVKKKRTKKHSLQYVKRKVYFFTHLKKNRAAQNFLANICTNYVMLETIFFVVCLWASETHCPLCFIKYYSFLWILCNLI